MTLSDVIAKALLERMPRGDLTARHLKLEDSDGTTRLTAAEDLILAGRDAVNLAVGAFAPEAEFGWQFEDGATVLGGQTVGWIKAPPSALLTAAPLALHFLGRASGIATLARCYVHEMRGTHARVMSAPSVTPGLREIESEAVRRGGALMPDGDASTTLTITADHARAAGSLREALHRVRQTYAGPVHVECATLVDVDHAVEARAARILVGPDLDAATVRARVPTDLPLEAGGTLTLPAARALALARIDFVRVDQLLDSAPRAEFRMTLPSATPP